MIRRSNWNNILKIAQNEKKFVAKKNHILNFSLRFIFWTKCGWGALLVHEEPFRLSEPDENSYDIEVDVPGATVAIGKVRKEIEEQLKDVEK